MASGRIVGFRALAQMLLRSTGNLRILSQPVSTHVATATASAVPQRRSRADPRNQYCPHSICKRRTPSATSSARRRMPRGRNLKLTEDPHRRLNALTNEWVLVSPHRTTRPWQGEVAKLTTASEPAYDPSCYLCPGNSRVGGVRNPVYTTTFVFENDFAALKPQIAHGRLDVESMGLLVAESEPGICRVICFSPRHDLTLATMGLEGIEQVVRTWIGQFRELSGLEEIHHVQIFENRGA